MIEVPAAVTISGVLASVASGATASAEGVMPKPARKFTFSLTNRSWAMRLVLSGIAPSSLMMRSIFLPATVSPCCAIHSLAAAASCLPVDCCWPGHRQDKADLDILGAGAAGGGQRRAAQAAAENMPLLPNFMGFSLVGLNRAAYQHSGSSCPGPRWVGSGA